MHALRIVAGALLVAALVAPTALAADPEPAQPVVVEIEGGFQWEAAGLGAAAGVAASLLVLGLVFAARRPAEGADTEDRAPRASA